MTSGLFSGDGRKILWHALSLVETRSTFATNTVSEQTRSIGPPICLRVGL